MAPGVAAALTFALFGTILLGVYPRPLFELAEVSAKTLGIVGVAATSF